MRKAQNYYPNCPEPFVVSLARTGDRLAFEDLVRRRQSSIRGLMRRFCGDSTLADDLAQQVFLRVWLKIRTLKEAKAFPAWLKKLAVSIWLQYLRKNDALRNADEIFAALHRWHRVLSISKLWVTVQPAWVWTLTRHWQLCQTMCVYVSSFPIKRA